MKTITLVDTDNNVKIETELSYNAFKRISMIVTNQVQDKARRKVRSK